MHGQPPILLYTIRNKQKRREPMEMGVLERVAAQILSGRFVPDTEECDGVEKISLYKGGPSCVNSPSCHPLESLDNEAAWIFLKRDTRTLSLTRYVLQHYESTSQGTASSSVSDSAAVQLWGAWRAMYTPRRRLNTSKGTCILVNLYLHVVSSVYSGFKGRKGARILLCLARRDSFYC